MAFDLNSFDLTGTSPNTNSPNVFKYGSTTDTLATILASGYFISLVDGQRGRVKVGDVIWVAATDDQQFVEFIQLTPTVETQVFDVEITDGSITTAKLANNAVTTIKIADNNVTTSKIPDGDIIETKITQNSLTENIINNLTVADSTGALVSVHRIDTAGGATGNTDLVFSHKAVIIQATAMLAGAGGVGALVKLHNLEIATDITTDLNVNLGDKSFLLFTSIDDASWVINSGQTLRVTETDGGGVDSPPLNIFVYTCRIA